MPGKEQKKIADERLKKAYDSAYTSVYRFCLSKLKNHRQDVEDCVQEAFLALYHKYLAGAEIENPTAFLLQTAYNFIKREYRQLEKAQNTVDIEEIREIPSQDEDIDERLTFEQYSRQISAALNDTDAEIFSLRYIEEFKIEEVARRMDMSISAVTTRLSRMKEKIRRVLGEDFFR